MIKIEEIKNETRTIIIYEAPHKLKNTLDRINDKQETHTIDRKEGEYSENDKKEW